MFKICYCPDTDKLGIAYLEARYKFLLTSNKVDEVDTKKKKAYDLK